MPDNQAEFKGWAKVEVMGHQSHVGYVTTEAYGQAVLFRIDRPAIPESEETLDSPEWVGDQYCQAGSVIKRAAVDAQSVLVGSGSIYRIVPCDEGVALKAIHAGIRRPLSVVKLVGAPQLTASTAAEEEDDENDAAYDDSDREEDDIAAGGVSFSPSR